MEDVKEDIREKYPSLPPNYVSLAQLQERWIAQKQKEAEQKEQIASGNHQQQLAKQNKGFNQSSKKKENGVGRVHSQGLHVPRDGELKVDAANMVYVPRKHSDGNLGQTRKAKGKWKTKKLEIPASGHAGGSGIGNAKDKEHKKYNGRKRRPRVKEGQNGEDLVHTFAENREISGAIGKNGGKEGYSDYENERIHEIVSESMAGLTPEIKGKEVNPVDFSRKPRGKLVVDDKFSDNTDNQRVETNSLGKQMVDHQFSNDIDGRRVAKSRGKQVVGDQVLNASDSGIDDVKSCGKQAVNGQFCCSTNDQKIEVNYHGKKGKNGQFLSNMDVKGSADESMVEVLPENRSEDENSSGLRRKNSRRYNNRYERYKRGGTDKGLLGEGNLCRREVLQDNKEEEEEEVPLDERKKSGKERSGSRFCGNEGNWRTNRNSNGIQSKLGQHFGDSSFHDSRKGNFSRGHRWSYGNSGIVPRRKGKQVDGGLVWVKKVEKSDSNAEVS